MRIGLDATPIDKQAAGIGFYIKELLVELVQALPEDQFFLYTTKETSYIRSLFSSFPNVEVRRAPFLSFSHALWTQASLPFYLRRDKIDLFWATTQSTPLITLNKCLSILTIHDFVYRISPASMTVLLRTFFRTFMPLMVKKADYIFTNSQATADRLIGYYNREATGILFPPIKRSLMNKVSCEAEQFITSHNLQSSQYLITIGTIEPRKNFDKLLTIYEQTLIDQEKNILPLVIVGGGGWKNAHLKKRLDRMRKMYPDHIKVLGYLSDEQLSLLLRGSKALVMVSSYEGYGMPLAEARSCDVPVIATDIPEMREASLNQGIFIQEKELEQKLSCCFHKQYLFPLFKKGRYPSNKVKVGPLLKIITQIRVDDHG